MWVKRVSMRGGRIRERVGSGCAKGRFWMEEMLGSYDVLIGIL
jgi:hypothetical protein